MSGYKLISLFNMLDELGEKRVKSMLGSFLCPLNKDVERYLHETAIVFAQQNLSPTTLVYAPYKQQDVLAGYFTLANKILTVDANVLSQTLRKRIAKFAIKDSVLKRYRISAPLIAQIGKNFKNGYNKLITGDELLKMACDRAKEAQQIIGGKIVYLECEDKPQLLEFYERNAFVNLGQRKLDRDEQQLMKGEYLVQLLKYTR